MNQRKQISNYAMGKLPAIAPLASPYVPYQMDNPEQYEAGYGLVRGTIYPGLDLPFMGMSNKKTLPATPMSELQKLAFAIQELALYLDTHRDDVEALELYRGYQRIYHEKETEYVKKHGPLCHSNLSGKAEYEWLSDPWPWEYCVSKEG